MFSTFAFWCIVGFVIGGIPFGYLAGRIVLKDDIRKYGSGNIGATNTWRTLGWKCGVIVLILDALKGLLPTLLSAQFTAEGFDTAKIEPLQVATGLCAIAGHMFPIWLSFRGGKALRPHWCGTCAGSDRECCGVRNFSGITRRLEDGLAVFNFVGHNVLCGLFCLAPRKRTGRIIAADDIVCDRCPGVDCLASSIQHCSHCSGDRTKDFRQQGCRRQKAGIMKISATFFGVWRLHVTSSKAALCVLAVGVMLAATTGVRGGDIPAVGAKFSAKDSLKLDADSVADAQDCLKGLRWTPGDFQVICEAAQGDRGDLLVRFPRRCHPVIRSMTMSRWNGMWLGMRTNNRGPRVVSWSCTNLVEA